MGYKVTLVSDTHSTWDSNELLAQQIINHHNSALNWFADVYLSNEIKQFILTIFEQECLIGTDSQKIDKDKLDRMLFDVQQARITLLHLILSVV